MKQHIQFFKTGESILEEVPVPKVSPGKVTIHTNRSLVSPGTECMLEVFGIPTISWYGHTERAILAYEKGAHFTYSPFLSYGFSEAVQNAEGEYDLVSTSYFNYVSPLIRYNTEDVIEQPKVEDGILESFKILKGRSGEFVIDRDHKKVNLTGLIFGRHHELFNHADFIQVSQVSPGHIEILFVAIVGNRK